MNPIQAALDHMRKVGWTQNVACRPSTAEVCAIGALALQTPERSMRLHFVAWQNDRAQIDTLAPYLAQVIKDQYPDYLVRCNHGDQVIRKRVLVVAWNDEPGRTFEEVEAVFEKASLLYDDINF